MFSSGWRIIKDLMCFRKWSFFWPSLTTELDRKTKFSLTKIVLSLQQSFKSFIIQFINLGTKYVREPKTSNYFCNCIPKKNESPVHFNKFPKTTHVCVKVTKSSSSLCNYDPCQFGAKEELVWWFYWSYKVCVWRRFGWLEGSTKHLRPLFIYCFLLRLKSVYCNHDQTMLSFPNRNQVVIIVTMTMKDP